MPDKELSQKILTVGLEYKNPRGGIGSVIQTYSAYFDPFQFISTYKPQRLKVLIFPYFFGACLKLCFTLATRPKIKIVHIHGAAKGSLVRKYVIYALSKRLFGKKVIYHSHGSELASFYLNAGKMTKRFVEHFFNRVDQVICLSTQWELFFTQHFNVKRIGILENIVEDPGTVNRKQLVAGDPVKFLFLGLIGNRKGIFDLLTLLAEDKNRFQGKILLIIGGSGETKRLENFIQEYQLGTMVRFEGWVKGEKKDALLRESDVYILPSYNEGLPISILEAMSYRMPVISTPVGGTPVVVRERENGFLIPPGNKQGFGQAIEWFVQHKHAISEMGQASAIIVAPYFASAVIPKLTDTYINLLEL